MESPRFTSPPSIRIHDSNSSRDRYRTAGRFSSATPIPARKPSGPMSIPNAREELAPPALPPPKYIEGLAFGNDPGWQWGNTTHGDFSQSTLAPIKPGSSLMGSYRLPIWEEKEDKTERRDFFHRGSSVSTLRSHFGTDNRLESIPPADDDFYQTTNASIGGHQFQGENELSQKILGPSSSAYDKHLVSKIGKPSSPPRHSSLGSPHDAGLITKLPFHSKDSSKFSSLSISDASPKGDSASRLFSSPPSGVSPAARPSWGKDYMDYRSPSVDSSVVSSAVESDHYAYLRGGSGRSSSGFIMVGFDEGSSLPSHSARGSYDQSSWMDPETDFPMDEAGGGMGKLHIDDRPVQPPGGHSPLSKQGMKRRASSPRQNSRDVKQQLHTVSSNGDLYQQRVAGQPFPNRSPVNRFPNGSISSGSSASLRNGSLASSAVLSAGGSSITSISSLDPYSAGGISPNSDLDPLHDSPYVTPVSLNPSPRGSLSASRPPSALDTKTSPASRKAPVQAAFANNKPQKLLPKQGGFICQCCLKKPKKFDTVEDLQTHEMEKQYTCQYCQNRFKNKNEAERHQNSLHLRPHSWSCAALGVRYHDAFHPSSSPGSQTAKGSAMDACGYCGEEFSNFPQADWDRRLEHLTSIHKFGECNQAKKFFRADHFRQHLKHSHAGTSGKWTNMLENACMKEEPAPVPLAERMTGGMGDTGPRMGNLLNGLPSGHIGAGMVEPTIDEVHDES